MNEAEFQQVLRSPATRTANYHGMVNAFYERVTETFRDKWSNSFHFAIFDDSETLEEALVATERAIAREGGFKPGMKVLDVGCGVGGPALNIAEYSGVHVTGINIVPRHLEIAERRAAERGLSHLARFELADAMSMPFAEGSFDAVYIFEAGCHMPDKPAFYRQCARVLRPGGLFLGHEWIRREGLTPEEEVEYIEPVCKFNAVPYISTLRELGDYIEEAGLQLEALDDVSKRGNFLRNWELVDNKVVRGIRRMFPWLLPPTLRLLTDNGLAVCKAARAGAFIIGHWRARKPLP